MVPKAVQAKRQKESINKPQRKAKKLKKNTWNFFSFASLVESGNALVNIDCTMALITLLSVSSRWCHTKQVIYTVL